MFPLRKRAELRSSCPWAELQGRQYPRKPPEPRAASGSTQNWVQKSHVCFRWLKTTAESNNQRKEIQILFLSNTIQSFTRAN